MRSGSSLISLLSSSSHVNDFSTDIFTESEKLNTHVTASGSECTENCKFDLFSILEII